MISIEHDVKVILYFSHRIGADKNKNTQFVNSAPNLDVLLVSLLIICTRRVDEIEYQCSLAQFFISNKGAMRC